jgi:hypothetical protein
MLMAANRQKDLGKSCKSCGKTGSGKRSFSNNFYYYNDVILTRRTIAYHHSEPNEANILLKT